MKRLYIIGSGPGNLAHLTPAAEKALTACSDLVGHGLFFKLLGKLAAGKQPHKPPMGEEITRARLALDLAASHRTTALISSAEAGIYAMATVVFELLDHQPQPHWQGVDIEVIPGVSAMPAAAARVGAPLAHDFCAISLSDLLTPWEVIKKRIYAAGQGDFVVAFYNAVSKHRTWQLSKAKKILLHYRNSETPTIVAFNVTRPGESITITSLGQLNPDALNMLTLVLVGNWETRCLGNWVYTPRGYRQKLDPPLEQDDDG